MKTHKSGGGDEVGPGRDPLRPGTVLLALAGICLFLGVGCSSARGGHGQYGAGNPAVQNVYRDQGALPAHIKRVVVLPVVAAGAGGGLEEGREAMQEVLLAELMATRRFEFVSLGKEQCRSITGKSQWLVSEELPRDMLEKLRKDSGCDAVLFGQLTQFKPYAPVSIGWRLQLVSIEPVRVLWAVDELFDGSDPSTAAAAQSFYRRRFASRPGNDPQSILSSPRRFGQYVAASMASTLPSR